MKRGEFSGESFSKVKMVSKIKGILPLFFPPSIPLHLIFLFSFSFCSSFVGVGGFNHFPFGFELVVICCSGLFENISRSLDFLSSFQSSILDLS